MISIVYVIFILTTPIYLYYKRKKISTSILAFFLSYFFSNVCLFILSFNEGIENMKITEFNFGSIYKSINYFVFWVLSYWLYLLIILSLIIGLLFKIIKKSFLKNSNSK